MASGQEVYRRLVEAITSGSLTEPFSAADFQRACPGFSQGTYRAFVWKHSGGGNTPTDSVLLQRVSPGRFTLLRPLRYGP